MDLRNHFLIAMPNLPDPNFQQTVIYICEHDEQGAIGLVLTRPAGLNTLELLQQLDIKATNDTALEAAVMSGGPVTPQNGFILHRPLGNWSSTLPVVGDIGLTTSRDVLEAMAQGRGPDNAIVTLGYAGWGNGQLEDELANNTWLTLPANGDMLFNTAPDQLWHAASKALGIDIRLLSGDIGHA